MNYKASLFLGVVQGLTEFLPVSSSGHLVLASKLLNLGGLPVSYGIWLHVGTLFSSFVFLRQEILWILRGLFSPKKPCERREVLKVLGLLVMASVPAAVFGILLQKSVEDLFGSGAFTGVGLIITGAILYLSKGFESPDPQKSDPPDIPFSSVTPKSAGLMGLFQAVAIIPGISRSGSTICAGLFGGVTREDAAKFSFLMAMAVISGGAILDIRGMWAVEHIPFDVALLGLFSSFLSGLIALSFVLGTLKRGKFSSFSYYCFALGLLALAVEFI